MKVLEIKNLNKNFGKNQILRNVSFEVAEGEIVAVLGESGCGKSTLLSTIAGFFGIEGGEIWLYGEMVANAKFFAPPKVRNVGILFQDYALFPHFSVRENILFGIAHLPKDEQERRFCELVEMLGLEALCERYPNEISGGQQQRVALARCLAPRPKMILFDEPFSNLNHTMSVKMRRDIKAILARHGLSAILVTHHREDAFYLADKIVLMERGEIIDKGAPKALYENPRNATSAEFLGAVSVISKEEIKGVQNPAFRAWLEAKNGLIRPKELKLIQIKSAESGVESGDFSQNMGRNLGRNLSQKSQNLGRNLAQKSQNLGWNLSQKSQNLGRNLSQKSQNLGQNLAQNHIYAEVLENIFYGDYYEVVVKIEDLRFALHLDFAIGEGGEIILQFN